MPSTVKLPPNFNQEMLKRDLARRFLGNWCQYVDQTYRIARHHKTLIDALTRVEKGELKRLLITMPPRHGKSLTTSVRFPSWFMGRNPDAEVLVASYAAALAQSEFGRRSRNEFEAWGPEVFGVKLDRTSSSVARWGIEGHRGAFRAVGVDGGVTGKGADIIIVDDPVKGAKEAASETIRMTAQNWYQMDLSTRLQPGSKWGAIIIVMTRWHEADLAGFVLSEQKLGGPKWEVLNFPMLDEDVDPPQPLWPEMYSLEACEQIRAEKGSRGWSALYQGRPVPSEGGMFKRQWWRSYDKVPSSEADEVLPAAFDIVCQSWDMAFKGTQTSDFVVGCVIGKKGATYWLLDLVRGRWNMPETLEQVLALSEKWPDAQLKLIESAANGPGVIDMLHSKLEGLIAVRPDGGKEARASAASPPIESGNVYLPTRRIAPWVDAFMDEFTSFPSGANDDQVDAFCQGLNRLLGMDVWSPRVADGGGRRFIVM